MCEVVGAFAGCEAMEQVADGGPQRLKSAWRFGAQQLLELGKDVGLTSPSFHAVRNPKYQRGSDSDWLPIARSHINEMEVELIELQR